MLKRLIVQNFAIIENIDITFKDGLTVLTGETGAGKSLIIDSLSLLLGERASTELIRTGCDKAIITGYFSHNNIYLKSLLTKLNVNPVDELVIERVISTKNSYIKVNSVTITLSDLKNISKYLADIHMQFDNEKILNPENYLEIIDNFKYELTNEYKSEYSLLLSDFNKVRKEYLDLLEKAKEFNERRDYLEYSLKELDEMALEKGEDIKINEEISILKNFDKFYSIYQNLDSLIREDFTDKLYESQKLIEDISSFKEDYKEYSEKINDYYYEIDSIFDNIKKDFKRIEYDPNRLNELETRLNDIDNLKKKYKKSLDELVDYKDELKKLLSSDESFDELIKNKLEELKDSYNKVYSKGLELTKIRKEIAKSIKNELEKNMKDLSLNAVFEVSFKDVVKEDDYKGLIFRADGLDEVDFLIETNIGEGLKTLSKTISGGESSRIMLSIKALFIKSQKIETVIFDEIDTGISGKVARDVAKKIYEISLNTQVISITHLPQVASLSKNHIKISKDVKGGRTYTSIKELNLDEKIYEVALMISGGKVTESQLEYAKEMILNKE